MLAILHICRTAILCHIAAIRTISRKLGFRTKSLLSHLSARVFIFGVALKIALACFCVCLLSANCRLINLLASSLAKYARKYAQYFKMTFGHGGQEALR